MKKILKQSLNISILILVISLMGCEIEDAFFPKVNSGFTYTLNKDTGTVSFINISENSRNYLWTFGDGGTSTEINPIKTYANGTYTVTLKAINASGASATFEDVITINIPNPMVVPITFDDPNVAYKGATFNGASFKVVDNPSKTGTNNKATKVGEITNSGAQWEGVNFDLGTQLDLSAKKTITMNFWSNSAVSVLMKLEQGTGPDVEVSVNHGGTGWEKISFNFNSSNKYVRLTFFVDGPGTKAGAFYLDDIAQIETPVPPCTVTTLQLPIDFESCLNYESKRVAGGIDFSIVDNPQLTGANAVASKVGKIINKGDNWENLNFKLDTPINFTTNKTIKVKLYSTVSVPIKLKLETGGTPVEKDKTHGGTGWEELTFDFTTSESFSNIIIFIDGPGNTAGTFYVDDIKHVAGGGGGTTTGAYIYATSAAVTIPSTIADWGTGTTINPEFTGDATYSRSIKLTSGTGWGPVSAVAFTAIEAGKLSKYSTLNFKIKTTDYTKIKVKVPEVEKEFPLSSGTALAGGWIQMSIPLASTFGAGTVNAAVEFAIFEFGVGTMLITDVMLSGDGTVVPPSNCPAAPAGELLSNGGFEAGAVCWQLFDGATISSTVAKDGTKSAQLQGATGKAVGMKMERFGVGAVLPNTSYTVSFDVIASGPFGEGGVFKAFTFSEGADGGSVGATQHILADGVTSLPTTWEKKTYTFTTAANANQVAGGLSFLIEIVNSSVKLNIDNVVIKKTP